MKKRRLVLYVLSFLLLAFTASFLWSMYTTAGTSFLLKGIERVLQGTMEMKKVTGRIGYSLHVEGFRLNLADLTVAVDTADLKWQPSHLITGKVAITELGITGLSITDTRPPDNEPVDLLLPRVPRWLTGLYGWVHRLNIDRVKYVTPGSEPVTIDGVSATVLWDRGILYLNNMNVRTAYGSAAGIVTTNLARPALRAQFTVTLPNSPAGIDTLSLDARLPASKGDEQIAGPLVLTAAAGEQERYSLQCRVGVARHALRISEGKFSRKDGKGSAEARGTLDVSGGEPAFTLSAKVTGLDLAPEVKTSTDLSGNLDIAGTLKGFEGKFDLKNRGASWKSMELKGGIRGDSELIELKDLEARLLGGVILGDFSASRARDMRLSTRFTAKGLNPARLHPGLEGNLNLELKGQLLIPENQPMEGSLTASLRESRFQKKTISGSLDTSLSGEVVKINALAVKGNGFALTADGILQKRLACEIRIDDASKLLPGAAGSLFAKGWGRWLKDEPAGALTARGRNISYANLRVSSLNASMQMPDGDKGDIAVDITGRDISYGILRASTFSLAVSGKTGGHRIVLNAAYDKDTIDALAQGKYADGAWQGTILKISGTQDPFGRFDLAGPATVNVSKKRVGLSPFILTSPAGEKVDMSADITLEPMVGFAGAKWQQLNLARAGGLMGRSKLQGRTSGETRAQWLSGGRLALSGDISGSGAFSQGSMMVKAGSVNGKLNWDRSGLSASLDMDLGNEGRVNTRVSSKQPAAFSVPGQGSFQAVWKGLNMNMLQPMLPDTVRLKGRLSGEVKGGFLPGNRFDLAGQTGISDGSFSWRGDQGEITAPIREAAIDWAWKDTSLKGTANLRLAQYGHAKAVFQVPLGARFPVTINSGSPATVSIQGAMSEKGLLAALFPGLARETSGQVDFDLTGTGTFADPRINGRLNLKGASAYLPPAGIHLKDTSADVQFDNNRIVLSSFLVRSGAGHISGTGVAVHDRGKIRNFEAILKGERFEAVGLPELRASVNPDLTFSGDAKKVSVRGSVLISQALIREEQKETLIKPSLDVIVEGREKEPERSLPLAVDMTVAVTLGDEVLVKAYGIDTRLAGRINITMTGLDDVRASGNISTVKGRFDAYGVKLDIKRGRIAFGGGPVDRATLDILALRTVSDVSAGVLVTGTPASPIVNLYSEPPMPDRDILSYIVLGRPGGTAGQSDTALLARAAGGLLTGGKSSAIKKQLGLDVLDVESADGDISKSIVKVGKYLSPKLFISYGRSIYTGENIFGIRYSLTKRVDVESTMGNQSGASIYYRIEFN